MPEKKMTRYIEVSLCRKTVGLLENSYRKRALACLSFESTALWIFCLIGAAFIKEN